MAARKSERRPSAGGVGEAGFSEHLSALAAACNQWVKQNHGDWWVAGRRRRELDRLDAVGRFAYRDTVWREIAASGYGVDREAWRVGGSGQVGAGCVLFGDELVAA